MHACVHACCLDRVEVAIPRNIGGSPFNPHLMLAVQTLNLGDKQSAGFHKFTTAVARLPPSSIPWP